MPVPVAGVEVGGDPLEEQPGLGEHQLDVDARGDLDPGVVLPGPHRVGPGLHLEGPRPGRVRGDPGVVAVGDLRVLEHPHRGPAVAVRAGEHHLGAQLVVSLPEHGRRDREGLADGRLGRLPTEVDDGHHVHHGDSSDHVSTLPNRLRPCKPEALGDHRVGPRRNPPCVVLPRSGLRYTCLSTPAAPRRARSSRGPRPSRSRCRWPGRRPAPRRSRRTRCTGSPG